MDLQILNKYLWPSSLALLAANRKPSGWRLAAFTLKIVNNF